jgi:hypothetical protein
MSPTNSPRPERPPLGSVLGVTPFQGWCPLPQRTWGCALRAPPQAVTSQAFSPKHRWLDALSKRGIMNPSLSIVVDEKERKNQPPAVSSNRESILKLT